jgi:hypothetical protein
MKKIYLAFLVFAFAFSELTEAQQVQWMTSTTINYSMNPEMPSQPACASANKIFAARLAGSCINYGIDMFGAMAIDCHDPSGTLMWTFPIGDSVTVRSITSDQSGNVYVAGVYMETMRLGNSDSLVNTGFGFTMNLFLFSLDGAGNLVWKRNVSLAYPDAQDISNIEVDPAGNCWYELSHFDSASIKRLDANGSEMQSYLINGIRTVSSFSFDAMGNMYLAGSTGLNGPNLITVVNTSENIPDPYMMFLARIDASGNCSWIRLATDVTFQSPNIVATSNGDAYLSSELMMGMTFGSVTFDGAEWVYDIFIVKVDSTGNFHWGVEVPHQQTLTGDFRPGKNNFIDADTQGNVYLTGNLRGVVDWGNGVITDVGAVTSDGVSIISWDSSGIARWQMTGTSTTFATPYSLVVTGVDECYFANSSVGEFTIDQVSTNLGGNNYAFILGSISASTGINEADGNGELMVYPNPADQSLNVISYKTALPRGVAVGLHETANQFSIYSVFGEKVKDIAISSALNNYQIDVSKLSSGIYFLTSGDIKKKIVVQH